MKNWITAMLVRRFAAPVWKFMDGKKTYGTAALSILTGAAGLAPKLGALLAAHDVAGLLAFAQGLSNDPAWAALLFGFGLLGLGHKATKSEAAAAPVKQ